MELKLKKGFQKNVAGKFGKYEFEVGILNDGPHKEALTGVGSRSAYAGGPIRKKSRIDGPLTIAQVSAANRERLGFNYLVEPFTKKSSDIIKFSQEFFKYVFGKSEKRRLENLLQAIVRNPILRGDYGSNGPITRRLKGFDRKMIDTAQLFKAIKAVVRVRSRGV